MQFDIDGLSEADLIDLNNRVVERIKFIRLARTHHAMLQFRIGELVWFDRAGGGQVKGVITKYNKKSVTVLVADGQHWRVYPGFLHKMESDAPRNETSATIFALTPR